MEKQSAGANDSLQRYISDGTPDEIRERYASLAAAAAAADYGELDRNVVVVDTETTGFSFNHDELIQIAAARMECGKIVDWYVTFVDPGKPIPEEIVHLTGITGEDVAGAPSPNEALAGLAAFAGDAMIVAHNVGFDHTFTTKHPGGYPLLENTWVDSLDLARIALPRLTSHRLLDLVRAFDAPLSTHRADADVEATCAVFRILLAAVEAMPVELVAKIASLAPASQWPTSVVFSYFAERAQAGEPGRKAAEAEGAAAAGLEGDLAQPEGEAPAPAASEEAAPAPAEPDGQTALFAADAFSLRALRRERLGTPVRHEKADADVLASDPLRGLSYPSAEEVAAAFAEDGTVGSLYESFELRTEQVEMAQAVRSAFEASENLVVEAGTGVGKSMAYLLPAALTAVRNNIAIGVATKTNALLDQLVYHELPALSKACGGLSYAPLKGFSHYPCLRRIERIASEGAQMRTVSGKEVSQAPALAALLSFVEQTAYDDMDGLKIDYRVLPRRAVTTTSHDCLRRKCPYFGTSCFVHGARRQAEAADIVVTNHSLLFCDLAADGGLLPPIRYWVVDEAHGAEAEARRAFSLSLAADDIMRLAGRVSADEASRNVFVRAERKAVVRGAEDGSTLLYALTNKAKAAGREFYEAAAAFTAHMKDLLYFDTGKHGRGYEFMELWLNDDIRASETYSALGGLARTFAEQAEKLVRACQELVGLLEDFDHAADVQREIASIAMGLKDLIGAADVLFGPASEKYAYAATLCRKKDRMAEKLEALVINVGGALGETLYARTHSVVFASATLSVDGSFDAFERAMGLNEGEASRARALQLDSSYDFDRCMTVYVASDMPEPNDPAYLPALERLLVAVHKAQRGSMLTLFTNRREMEKCFDAVQPELKACDLRLVCQKWGVSVKGLRDEFLADEHLSLFALKSFWEGFDAPGATLRGVVIPKLPFAKPTDPLSCERAARDDAAWRRYVLPAAVIETKQAAGRLIRKADDTGVLVLADRRLISKGYGKAFLGSLPSRTIKVLTCAQIADELGGAQ